MGQGRDRRRREEKRRGGGGRRDGKLDVRRRVKGLLGRFSLLGAFEGMPAYLRDQFFDCCGPDPVLVFDDSFPSAEVFGGAYAEIRSVVRAGFEEAVIELTGFELAVRDFYAIAIPLEAMVRRALAKINSPLCDEGRPPATLQVFLEKSAGILNYLVRQEVVDASFHAMHKAVVVPLVARSRLDGNLLHARPTNPRVDRGRRLTMTLYAEKPAMKVVRLRMARGGGTRSMYRVGTANAWNGIEWAWWSRENVKGLWADHMRMRAADKWPVFVQGHALERLRSRLDTYAHADWGEHWMYESLKHPTIGERAPDGNLMVAFEVQGKRLGYLVATVGDGLIAVRTFLFLTMRNTYEGRELSKRLKLTHEEIAHFRLHELSRFTRTDLKDDPDLRRIFKQCGCAHLFELAEDEHALDPTAQKMIPFAAELKQYAQMAA